MSDYLEIARQVMRARELTSTEPLEAVLKGFSVELDLVNDHRLFIVADQEDARRLGKARGSVYTAAEVRRMIQIGDPATIAEVNRWKREFNGTVSGVVCEQEGASIRFESESKCVERAQFAQTTRCPK